MMYSILITTFRVGHGVCVATSTHTFGSKDEALKAIQIINKRMCDRFDQEAIALF